MIDLLLEKNLDITYTYWYENFGMYFRARAYYLGQEYGVSVVLPLNKIENAKFDIMRITEQDLKNQLIKIIQKNLTTTL
jgi:hypothetical protein